MKKILILTVALLFVGCENNKSKKAVWEYCSLSMYRAPYGQGHICVNELHGECKGDLLEVVLNPMPNCSATVTEIKSYLGLQGWEYVANRGNHEPDSDGTTLIVYEFKRKQ